MRVAAAGSVSPELTAEEAAAAAEQAAANLGAEGAARVGTVPAQPAEETADEEMSEAELAELLREVLEELPARPVGERDEWARQVGIGRKEGVQWHSDTG